MGVVTLDKVTVDCALAAVVDFRRYSTLMPLVRCRIMLFRRALLVASERSGSKGSPGSSKIIKKINDY